MKKTKMIGQRLRKGMTKGFGLLLALCMILTSAFALAENNTESSAQSAAENTVSEEMGTPLSGDMGTPPDMPSGSGTPPERPSGEMGTPPDGSMGTPPDGGNGGPGGGMGGPGGGSSFSGEYTAVVTADSDTELTESLTSTGTDENALLVTDGQVSLTNATVTRTSSDSTGGDNASFYGVGAALLTTGGTLTVDNVTIDTDAAGGAGVFSYGDGTAYVSNSTIHTTQGTSGGIHVAGGGKLYAENLTVTTEGGSSAAIRSDRGSGTMVVNGGSYTANGSGSPAVYVTADISIKDAELTATGSEALCLEGLNSVRLYDCTLTGNMPDQSQNDNTWTVILYQSMSGDSQVGEGSFTMDGGKLVSQNGGLFYTTNTDSVFVLRGVEIEASEDHEYFLRATGNSNARGWGSTGKNGANCVFTAIDQVMDGDILWDSISTLNLYVTESSELKGAILDDESCAGDGGNGSCRVVIDESSVWVVRGDSVVTTLECAGQIIDEAGRSVSIVGTDGTVYVQGDSDYTVTVTSYTTETDLSGAGTIDSWEDHAAL